MGLLGRLFGGGGTNKNNLIKHLVKERIQSSPGFAARGFDESMVDSLSSLQLAGLPESTIVTIVESWVIMSNRGVPDAEIFESIEAHRSRLAGSGDMSSELSLSNYIKYRIDLEHQHAEPISDDFIDYAIDVSKQTLM